jgi:nitroreductase
MTASAPNDPPAAPADVLPERLLRARYGTAMPDRPLPGGALVESLLAHRTVRAFSPQPLPPGTLETLVAAAQSAPSSSNLQAWSVVAVEDPARRARLSELANDQAHIRECPLLLVWIADLSRLDRLGERTGVPTDSNRFLEMFVVAVVDATLAAQNALVAAESMGLGTCYIGAMRNRPEEVAAELGLPPDAFAVFGLCVGRPDASRPAAEVKPRLPQPAVMHRERWSSAAEAEAIARYEPVMRAFQASQHMQQAGWTAQATARVRGPEGLSGRHRLREALDALGFGLR